MNAIDITLLATVTGGASTAVTAVQDAVMSRAGHAGNPGLRKEDPRHRGQRRKRVGARTFSPLREPGTHSYCGTYDPRLGSPSPDINVKNLAIH